MYLNVYQGQILLHRLKAHYHRDPLHRLLPIYQMRRGNRRVVLEI